MTGTCLQCGCTERRPCDDGGEPCCWVDKQKDFCSRCGRELILGPIEPKDLAEAALVIRALRAIVFELMGESDATLAPHHSIWTPNSDGMRG